MWLLELLGLCLVLGVAYLISWPISLVANAFSKRHSFDQIWQLILSFFLTLLWMIIAGATTAFLYLVVGLILLYLFSQKIDEFLGFFERFKRGDDSLKDSVSAFNQASKGTGRVWVGKAYDPMSLDHIIGGGALPSYEYPIRVHPFALNLDLFRADYDNLDWLTKRGMKTKRDEQIFNYTYKRSANLQFVNYLYDHWKNKHRYYTVPLEDYRGFRIIKCTLLSRQKIGDLKIENLLTYPPLIMS